LSREELLDTRHVVPGVRFAVDAYVTFARTQPWPIAMASSLTELFAPDLMAKRLEAFQRHYTWVTRRAGIFQEPADAGAAGLGRGADGDGELLHHARDAGGGGAGAAIQVRPALGATGRHPREVPVTGGGMSAIDEKSCPALATGVRMQTDATTGEPVLLFRKG